MQVYKTFLKVIKNYRQGIIMYACIVIAMVTVLGATTNNGSNIFEKKSYNVIVNNQDDSEIASLLVAYLSENNKVSEDTFTEDQITDQLYYQLVCEYIVIPEDFGEKFLSDGTNIINAKYDEALPDGMFVNMQMNQFLNSVKSYVDLGYDLQEAADKTTTSMDDSFVTMKNSEGPGFDIQLYTKLVFLPFGILSIIFSGMLPAVISFNEKEKKNRTMISPIKLTTRNIAIVFGVTTVSVVVTAVVLLIAVAPKLGTYINDSKLWLSVLNAYVYTFVVTMLLSMVASFPIVSKKNDGVNSVSFITNIIGLSFAFLGGTFVGLDMLGDGVKKIGQFLPNYWYSTACIKIWQEGASFTEVVPCYGLQLLFGVVCLAIGIAATRFFRENRE